MKYVFDKTLATKGKQNNEEEFYEKGHKCNSKDISHLFLMTKATQLTTMSNSEISATIRFSTVEHSHLCACLTTSC